MYTALTALSIGQEGEQIMANVFYSTFLTFFYFTWNVFYIYVVLHTLKADD